MKSLLAIFLLAVSALNAAERAMGWKSNPRHAKSLTQIVKHPSYKRAQLPASAMVVDLLPPVYDQEDIGRCTANAGCGAFDAIWKKQHGAFTFPSRMDLYTSSLKRDGTFPHDSGSYTSTVLWVLLNQGVCQEKTWPYNPRALGIQPPACSAKRSNFMAIKAYDVPNNDNGYSVKQCIANIKSPVLTGGYVFQSINNPVYDKITKRYIVPMPSGRPIGGHEILIVGYDDSMTWNGLKGFARIRNSWGVFWGDKGDAWVPYRYIFDPKKFEDNGVIETTK